MFLGPFAWDWPDGLEWAGARAGVMGEAEGEGEGEPIGPPAPMPDYQLRLPGVDSLRVATAAAGAVGTLVVFAAALALARSLEGVAPGRARPATVAAVDADVLIP
jgi:hypothetical protein